MLLAPIVGEPPRAVAERLGELVSERLGDSLDRVEVAGPGFLNLFMSDAWFRGTLARRAAPGDALRRRDAPRTPERVLVEFVSANPTGPLTWPPVATPPTATRSAASSSSSATTSSASTT